MIALKTLENRFEYIELSNAAAEAKIALQGAHLFHYRRRDEMPLLWVSEASRFEKGTAIRGGVPICWPWFGIASDASLPQHGFARTMMWELLEADETDATTTKILLALSPSEATLELWPHRFGLRLEIIVGSTLSLALTTTNTDDRPFELTEALHTYFAVSSIADARVEGLEGCPWFDALTGTRHTQQGPVRFTEETDRVYQEVAGPLKLVDAERTVTLTGEGSASAVVWNPWIDKCARMSGMNPDSYQTMLCIESANAMEDGRTLQPGASHTLKAVIR
jgi:glucose-6-phosphate 1-epimerase